MLTIVNDPLYGRWKVVMTKLVCNLKSQGLRNIIFLYKHHVLETHGPNLLTQMSFVNVPHLKEHCKHFSKWFWRSVESRSSFPFIWQGSHVTSSRSNKHHGNVLPQLWSCPDTSVEFSTTLVPYSYERRRPLEITLNRVHIWMYNRRQQWERLHNQKLDFRCLIRQNVNTHNCSVLPLTASVTSLMQEYPSCSLCTINLLIYEASHTCCAF